ncbi:MAG TPA: glycogen synthase [Acidobacteriota bacterium]|nr:glycogen synthase [Acidobacteriota bacterium]
MADMGIAFVASELAPFAKVGGLGDVASSLPAFLHQQGQDVRVFVPLYSRFYDQANDFYQVDFAHNVPVRLAGEDITFDLYTRPSGEKEPALYFIHCPRFYQRSGIYTGDPDEHLRFAYLSLATLASCQRMGWGPQIVHCNDWQTGLLPLYLKTLFGWDSLFSSTRTVYTIHNIGYQGVVGADAVSSLQLSEYRHLLHQDDLAQGRLSFMKTGILYSDVLTTVSPTYAREIQGEMGMGLQDMLRQRSETVVGILNGVDYDEWNPEKDPHIPHHYSAEDLSGKAKNKEVLLEKLGLPPSSEAPVVGIVSRMASQKGFELLFDSMPWFLANHDMRLTVLGSGEPRLEGFFAGLQGRFPGKVCYYRGYSEDLSHLIEAGADIFLMPSRYEPCGLNQMYSLRYGTVPVVRNTGGLADTVEQFDPQSGEGTGFVFDHYTAEGLGWALGFALRSFPRRSQWQGLMRNGMSKDFSWQRQGGIYIELYRRLCGAQD